MNKVLWLALLFPLCGQAAWKNETSAGIVINEGNSRSQSINASQDSAYKWSDDKNTLGLKANFLRTSTRSVETAKRWSTVLRYERVISDRLSLLAAQGLEADRFAGYFQRYNSDIGPKYVIYRPEDPKAVPRWLWTGEVGYRFTRERDTAGRKSSQQKARVYTEINRQWNDRTSSKFWIEYLPNFSHGRDWLVNAELSSSGALTNLLAFKVAYLVKYDNVPSTATTNKRDAVFTTSLVAKY